MNILGEVCVVVLYRARRVVSCFYLAAGAEEILCIERERRMYEMSDDAVDVRGDVSSWVGVWRYTQRWVRF